MTEDEKTIEERSFTIQSCKILQREKKRGIEKQQSLDTMYKKRENCIMAYISTVSY